MSLRGISGRVPLGGIMFLWEESSPSGYSYFSPPRGPASPHMNHEIPSLPLEDRSLPLQDRSLAFKDRSLHTRTTRALRESWSRIVKPWFSTCGSGALHPADWCQLLWAHLRYLVGGIHRLPPPPPWPPRALGRSRVATVYVCRYKNECKEAFILPG